MYLRIAQLVEQLLRDGAYITKMQYVLAVRRAGDLRQLTQLRSVAVSDTVDYCTDGLERLGGRHSTAHVDVRVTISYQDHHLNIPDPASPLTFVRQDSRSNNLMTEAAYTHPKPVKNSLAVWDHKNNLSAYVSKCFKLI